MTIEIVSDVNFYDPENLIPYLENDEAIIRNVTKGMLDFSNEETYAGSGAIASGTTFKSLTVDASIATAGSAFPAMSNGMLKFLGASPKVTLPSTFKLPTTTKRFMAIFWAKLPASGYQTGSSNVLQSLYGYAANTSTLCQWAAVLSTFQVSGARNLMQFYYPASGGSASNLALSDAESAALCNGELHQIALLFDGESVAGMRQAKIYVDKVVKASSAQNTWDGTLNSPATDAVLGYMTAFQSSYTADGLFLGRPSVWDLTGTGKNPEDIIAADWNSAQGYLA
ncbi:hypothetical protein [Pseudomonas sp.]|uniref:hypothetical protein n=1 Tax=Pseudomonas sp. TaxID=306 RepID=UPI00258CAD27|nr:hypothetical protein [Pseudomonas sp.]